MRPRAEVQKGRLRNSFTVWYKVLDNYICDLKECVKEGGGKTYPHEAAKKKHVKSWLQIYGGVPVSSKGPKKGRKDVRMKRAKALLCR